MNELIHRVLQGVAEPHEERMLAEWLDADEENRRIFDEACQLWELLGEHRVERHPVPRPTAELLIRAAEETEARSGPPSRAAERSPSHRRLSSSTVAVLAMAAGVAAIALVGVLSSGTEEVSDSLARHGSPLAGGVEFSTGPRETATLRLADGSIARLAPSSVLRIQDALDDADLRVVWLEGQAFFAVAADESRQFVVRSPGGETSVLGTRFEVRSTDSDLRVVVVDGRVRVARGEDRIELGKSEMALATADLRLEPTAVPDVFELLDWMEGTLVFQSTPVGRAIEEIRYRYGFPIVVQDAAISDLLITGAFANESFEQVMAAVCSALVLECSVEPDRALLRGPEVDG
jgi:transmembrane sensor